MTAITYPRYPVLIIDDEPAVLQVAKNTLNEGGVEHLMLCQDSRQVREILASSRVWVIVLDLWMPYVHGTELLSMIVNEHPEIPVIVVTGVNELETAVECMRLGAFDYIVKPVENARLISATRKAIELAELRQTYDCVCDHVLSANLDHPEAFAKIVTQNRVMLSILQYIEAIGTSHQPVLISGETGTGKELVAEAIHKLSGRPGSFVTVNVAGLDDSVFSDTLFGHIRGAFTGAESRRAGLIEQAADGTLFLDEIGDLSASSQIKLLRLLQNREYYPLGADVPLQTNTRIVVSTNKDLKQLQDSQLFRKDLYYRLKMHELRLPPLRERKDDLSLLLDHFLTQASLALDKKRPTAPPELLMLLGTYHFPGNIRELEAMVFDAVAKHKSHKISLDSFHRAMGLDTPGVEKSTDAASAGTEEKAQPLAHAFPEELPTVEEIVDLLVDEAMRRANGNQSIASKLIGISRSNLNQRLKKP